MIVEGTIFKCEEQEAKDGSLMKKVTVLDDANEQVHEVYFTQRHWNGFSFNKGSRIKFDAVIKKLGCRELFEAGEHEKPKAVKV